MKTRLSHSLKVSACALAITSLLSACNSSSSSSNDREQDPAHSPVSIGLLPDTQGGGWAVAMHPMEAVLAKHQEQGVDVVIPVGDLTDNGSTEEWRQWREVADKYREMGMEFLPVMGNHETSWAYTVEWIDNMRHYIPEDAVHMPSAEWLNYYIIRENVLMIGLAYYNLPIAFGWIQDVLAQHEGEFDHVVIASHDGLIGAKYGQTREQIVEGTKDDNRLFDIHKEIRETFAEHDVIWVQGHEHMYQRSQVHARVLGSNDPGGRNAEPLASTPSGGNYRMPSYTQIISGNASYKGYEYRYGERELIQDVILHKMDTMKDGSEHYDANASVLHFNDQRVDYLAFSAPHTINSNEEGPKELADPQWTLIDQFSRTTNRCESLVYPNSIPEGQRPILNHIVEFKTNDCVADDGSSARLIGGTNDVFNRVDTTERSLSFHEGFKRAESMNDLMRLSWQFLFTKHASWDVNLNGNNRIIPGSQGEDETGAKTGNVVIPATTIDMKKHVTLSWLPKEPATASDVLLVSGVQIHGGVYQSAYGKWKNIEKHQGYHGSQPDGSAKAPVELPDYATQNWNVEQIKSSPFGIEFTTENLANASNLLLAAKQNGEWLPLASAECVLDLPWDEDYTIAPPAVAQECADQAIVGYDSQVDDGRWWTIAQTDMELALISK
ncbi:metallophosphoesterase family protein [Aliagarivorans taiwanensis]|uniref:metallophosphoesterase family protein n=1 Tax=Aliagarivorans taiwanensis TaxID=561966 RepID=UPI00040BD07D|nr:metallophosphoesterase [Aliagarivorans taiwanensis]